MAGFKLKDLDVFYISYDEPNCEVNWERVISIHPDAKRIHGVLGFDRAHRICATASDTYRFVTIDGDNWLHDDLLDYEIIDDDYADVCFSFKSQNIVNGLQYGNGGVKVWNKETYLSTTSHELDQLTDFCWSIRYFHVDFLGSLTVNNCTSYQAWRAGYREGVKLSYVNGKPLTNFKDDLNQIWEGNLRLLRMWTTVGRDVNNGIWAILGARQGLYDLVTNNCVHTDINDYDLMYSKWLQSEVDDPDITATFIGQQLGRKFNFKTPELDFDASTWIKTIYVNPIRSGLMK